MVRQKALQHRLVGLKNRRHGRGGGVIGIGDMRLGRNSRYIVLKLCCADAPGQEEYGGHLRGIVGARDSQRGILGVIGIGDNGLYIAGLNPCNGTSVQRGYADRLIARAHFQDNMVIPPPDYITVVCVKVRERDGQRCVPFHLASGRFPISRITDLDGAVLYLHPLRVRPEFAGPRVDKGIGPPRIGRIGC